MQSLPDIRGIDLPAFKSLPDLTVLQDKYPVRGQRDALQDVGGKQHSPMLLIAQNLPVQIFRTLEIKAVDRLVQKEQSGLLEWLYPIRGWKIESDLWHHPRKYVVPVIMLLLAGGVLVRPVLLPVLLVLLAVEIIILLFICGRHPE